MVINKQKTISKAFLYLNQKCFISNLTPTIKELFINPPNIDSSVSANGHIKSLRKFKDILFIDISDGSIHKNLNIILKNSDNILSKFHLKVGQSIFVKGKWIKSKGCQDYELVCNIENETHKVDIIGNVIELYPVQKKSHTYQTLRNLPTLRHRTSTLASILRFRSYMETQLMKFFNSRHFIKVTPPLITGSDCEGAGEQFKIESIDKEINIGKDRKDNGFFGKSTYLTVSTQLHLEALCLSLNRVWTLTPCFRAEISHTNRHLSEFWMLEAEIAYISNVEQLTKFTEEMVKYITNEFKQTANKYNTGDSNDLICSRYQKNEIEIMKNRWDTVLLKESWPSITYSEAINIINTMKNKRKPNIRLNWGDSIQTEHEKWLAGAYFKSPVFITDYPSIQKPFYMSKSKVFDPERPTVACFDLILPEIGELIGGSIREHNYSNLIEEVNARNMNIDDIDWYLSTRLNGSMPHGGFGMGFERLLAYLCVMDNIKDVIPFPRAPKLCKC